MEDLTTLALFFCVVTAVALVWIFVRRDGLASIPKAGGPWLPIIGHAAGVIQHEGDLVTLLKECWAESGAVCKLNLQGDRLLINDPELAVRALNDRSLTKGPRLGSFKKLFRRGMASLPDGAEWALHRSLVRPFFQSSALRVEGERILQVIRARISQEQDKIDINLSKLTREAAFGVLFSVLFHGDTSGDAFRRILDSLSELNRVFVFADLDDYLQRSLPLGLGRLLPGANFKRSAVLCDEVRRIARDFYTASGTDAPLLDALTASSAYDASSLDDELLTLFFGGFYTTSIALQRALLLLAKHPAELTRLLAVIEKHYDAIDGLGSLSREPLCSALDAVIKESMRIDPPVGIHVRCSQDGSAFTLGQVTVPGHVDVFINVPAVHLNTRIWGDDAATFRPGRWLEDSASLQRFWIPFGGGQRVCVGSALSLLEQRIFLVEFLRTFPRYAAAERYQSVHGITNGFKKDVHVRVGA